MKQLFFVFFLMLTIGFTQTTQAQFLEKLKTDEMDPADYVIGLNQEPEWIQADETPLNSKRKKMKFICQMTFCRDPRQKLQQQFELIPMKYLMMEKIVNLHQTMQFSTRPREMNEMSIIIRILRVH